MGENNIRRLLIGAEIPTQYVYAVGNEQSMRIEGKLIKFLIASIEETKKHFIINVSYNGVVQQWKLLPKNNITSVEYILEL